MDNDLLMAAAFVIAAGKAGTKGAGLNGRRLYAKDGKEKADHVSSLA